MTLIRFVNSLVDAVQTPPFTLPAYHLANIVGLPSHFVELRHAATHETLPSLETLRIFAKDALNWLWKNYWTHLPAEKNSSEGDPGFAKNLCREWRRERRELLSKGESQKNSKEEYSRNYWAVVDSIREYQSSHEELFIEVLLSQNILIPIG